jgi:hypothetical protein
LAEHSPRAHILRDGTGRAAQGQTFGIEWLGEYCPFTQKQKIPVLRPCRRGITGSRWSGQDLPSLLVRRAVHASGIHAVEPNLPAYNIKEKVLATR